jgi:hypothetical protein
MRLALVAAAAATLVLTGCSGKEQPTPPGSNSSTSATSSPTADESPTGGTSDKPVPAKAVTRLLDWAPVETAGNTASTGTVTQGADFSLSVGSGKRIATLDRADRRTTLRAPAGFLFNDVVSDGDWLVLVAQDEQETKPGRATVIELASGKRWYLDGRSDLPTTNGGAWAIGDGNVIHATTTAAGRYCSVSVDLATKRSRLGYCAPKQGGFSQVILSPSATSLLTFRGQPQCRTVARLDTTRTTPFPGVPDCTGWDGAVTPTGAVWSVVTRKSRVEQSEFFASSDGGYHDLGVGTTGSLTWCGDSAYFVRDTQKDLDKARLLRWTPDAGLEVVYESPGSGEAFLAEPRCAGHVLSLSAFGEGGDEQVWATVPD